MKRLLPLLVVSLLPTLAQAGDPSDRARLILQARERDYFVQEGVGLKAVRIGHSLQHVLKTWGKPASSRSGLPLVGSDTLFYRADRLTEIRVSGRGTVRALAFRGQVGSPYQTSAGAQFGMKASEVRNIYGPPGDSQAQSGVIDYPRLGIRFFLSRDDVEGFEVYAPEK